MRALDIIHAQDAAWLADTYGLRLASTRDRLLEGEPAAVDERTRAEADAVLRKVSRGLWPVSSAAVRIASLARRSR